MKPKLCALLCHLLRYIEASLTKIKFEGGLELKAERWGIGYVNSITLMVGVDSRWEIKARDDSSRSVANIFTIELDYVNWC